MPVGYVYDPLYLQHDTGRHPENADRLLAIMDHLQGSGLLEQLAPLPARDSSLDDLLRCHSAEMVERVRRLADAGGGVIDLDTLVGVDSYRAALRAAGGALAAVQAVLEGQVQSAYALLRPPGHHATPHRSMGFCLFNNLAVAARWALDTHAVRRLAVVDFDVHHGNGTAEILSQRADVLLISTHQSPFYPGSGDWRDRGRGAGEGHTLNIPLPAGTGDAGYALAFERLVIPAVRRFEPELLLVSAGYDGHWSDPLAWMLLSLDGYRQLTTRLVELADELCHGRLAMMLEGGYQPQVLAHAIADAFTALLHLPPAPRDSADGDVFGLPDEAETPVEALVTQIAHYHALR